MPKALAYHCAVKYNDKVLIHGGLQGPKQPNKDTIIFDLTYKQWIQVPNQIPCGPPPVFTTSHSNDLPQPFYRTTCKIWDSHLIVATFDSEKKLFMHSGVEFEQFSLAQDQRY